MDSRGGTTIDAASAAVCNVMCPVIARRSLSSLRNHVSLARANRGQLRTTGSCPKLMSSDHGISLMWLMLAGLVGGRSGPWGPHGDSPCESSNGAYPTSSTQRYGQTRPSKPSQPLFDRGARDSPQRPSCCPPQEPLALWCMRQRRAGNRTATIFWPVAVKVLPFRGGGWMSQRGSLRSGHFAHGRYGR